MCREYDAARLAERPHPPIGRRVLSDMAAAGQRVVLIWKRVKSGSRMVERPWVFKAQSAVLRGVVPIGADPGMGLYAWRDFEYDEEIAAYEGESLGIFDGGDTDGIAAAIRTLAEDRRDKILELERRRDQTSRYAASTRSYDKGDGSEAEGTSGDYGPSAGTTPPRTGERR